MIKIPTPIRQTIIDAYNKGHSIYAIITILQEQYQYAMDYACMRSYISRWRQEGYAVIRRVAVGEHKAGSLDEYTSHTSRT